MWRSRPLKPRLLTAPRSLSVILPAYNEEALIADTLSHVMSVLSSWMRDFEVIVVNDGSKDRTGEIVAALEAYDRRIRLINHPVNKGYGAALVTGFESVTKELAFFMDSDGQFDIRDLARFFPLIEEYGAVLGYRIASPGHLDEEAERLGLEKIGGLCLPRARARYRLRLQALPSGVLSHEPPGDAWRND